ncbi:MAG TPA: hypothetical protein VGF71_02155, partial [Caulobacteraceae bacterium]
AQGVVAAPPDLPGDVALTTPGRGHNAEVAATIDALRAGGQSAEAIAAGLERHGLTAPPADTRTDTEKEFDLAFGPPPEPGDYHPSLFGRADGIDNLAAFNAEVQTSLAAMGMDPRVGEHVVERSLDLGRWYAAAGEAERQLWVRGERHDLEQKFGEEGVKRYIELAARALARAPEPFRDRLLNSGAAHSAEIIRLLALNETRLARRSGE